MGAKTVSQKQTLLKLQVTFVHGFYHSSRSHKTGIKEVHEKYKQQSNVRRDKPQRPNGGSGRARVHSTEAQAEPRPGGRALP